MNFLMLLVLLFACAASAPAPEVVCHSCDATVTELHKSLGSLSHRSETDVFDAIQGICAFKNFRVREVDDYRRCARQPLRGLHVATRVAALVARVNGSLCGVINPESIQACALSLSNAVSRPARHGGLPTGTAGRTTPAVAVQRHHRTCSGWSDI